MSKVATKTNNSHLPEKISLRLNSLPEKNSINVLDCYRGNNEIWKAIKKRTQKNINIIGIDKERNYEGLYLQGENIKFLPTMDLNQFDVIDLDAYGIPFRQLEIIFEKKFKGIIFITFIQSVMGAMNKKLLLKLGYTEKMFQKCQTLLFRNGFEKFKSYLYVNGIKELKSVSFERKHYLAINLNK